MTSRSVSDLWFFLSIVLCLEGFEDIWKGKAKMYEERRVYNQYHLAIAGCFAESVFIFSEKQILN